MELRLGLVLLCLLTGLTNSAPANNSNESKCSLKCSNDRSKLNYQPGKTYIYTYNSTTRMTVKNGQSPFITISARAEITAHHQCEMTLQLIKVELEGLEHADQLRKELEDQPLRFSYDNGKVESVCASRNDYQWAVNVKKGIISALQVSMDNLQTKQTLREHDIVGNCDTTYEPQTGSWKGRVVRKSKDMKSCGRRQRSIFSLFPSKYSSPDRAVQTFPMFFNDYNCEITIHPSIVSKVKCSDKSRAFPIFYSSSQAQVETKLELNFEKFKENAHPSAEHLTNYERGSLRYKINPENEEPDENKVKKVLKEICNNVNNEIEPKVPTQFTDLVYSIRPLAYSATYRIWKSIQDGQICSSQKLKDIFTDALLMDASEGSVKLIIEMINNKEVSNTKANYWMTLLTFANRPTEGAIKATLPLIKNIQSPRQALLGVSSFVHNFCQDEDVDCQQNPTINEVVRSLSKRLPKQCKESSENDKDDIIVALRALSNVGDLVSNEAINNILDCSTQESNSNSIRIAAIEALENNACFQNVQQKVATIFKDSEESTEVRIAAYKVMIQCPSQSVVKDILSQLRHETSKQVGSYVTSHLSNIQESSDPEKRFIQEAIDGEKIPTEKFSKDPRKYSQNFEVSHLFETLNVGAVVEADVVYDKSYAPRSLKFNVTVPVFGNSVNIMEVGVRQQGLEKTIESLAGPNGAFNGKSVPEIFREVADFFIGSRSSQSQRNQSYNRNEQNEERSYRHFQNDEYSNRQNRNEDESRQRQDKQDRIKQNENDNDNENQRGHPRANVYNFGKLNALKQPKDSSRSEEAEGILYLKIDGKYMLHLSIDDTVSTREEMKQLIDDYKHGLKNMVKSKNQDRAFSFMFLDSTYEYPGINGLPMKLDVKATTVVGYKQSEKGVFPSFSSELAVKMGFDVKSASPGILFTNTIHSSPSFQTKVEYKNSLPTKVLISMPTKRVHLFRYESNVTLVQTNNQQTPIEHKEIREHKNCINSLSKVTGLELCYQLFTLKPIFTLQNPIPAFNGPSEFALTLSQTDLQMKGWEYQLELPAHSNSQDSKTYRASFNTPGSNIDREIIAELQVASSKQNGRLFNLKLKSPFKQIEAAASHQHNFQKIKTQAKLVIDKNFKYSFEIGYQKEKNNEKVEYKPHLHLEIPNQKPVNLNGSLILTQGRKRSARFSLKSDQNKETYLEGHVTRSQLDKTNVHYSSDVRGNLGWTNFRVVGEAEKANEILSTKVEVEYQMSNSRKNNVQITGKLQNLSTAGLTKYVNFVELKSSQNPQRNFHWSWNFVHKKLEHLENEMTFMRDNPNSRLYLLQVSKFTGLKQRKVITTQNVVVMEAAPLNLNYEVKVNGQMKIDETPIFKTAVSARNRSNGKECRAFLEYHYESQKPLKLSMEASLKLPSFELSYNDRLEEVSLNTYKGQTNVRLNQNKQATLDYLYKYKQENGKTHRELDTQLKTHSMKVAVRHQALLRTSQNDVELKSRFENQSKQVWDIHTLLSKNGKSNFFLETSTLIAKAEADPFSHHRTASFDLQGKRFDLKHQSTFSANPKILSFNSMTTQNQKSFKINSRLSKNEQSHIIIESESYSVRLEANPSSTPMTGNIEVKSKPLQFSHNTQVTYQNGKTNVNSKNIYQGKNVLNIESTIAPRSKSYAKIETKNYKLVGTFQTNVNTKTANLEIQDLKNQRTHNSEASYESSKFKFNSKSQEKNQRIFNLDATIETKGVSKVDFENQHFSVSVDVNLESNTKKIEFDLEDKLHSHKHRTAIVFQNNEYTLTSNTKRGQQVILVNSFVDPKQVDMTLITEKIEGKFNVIFWSKGRLEVRSRNDKGTFHQSSFKVENGTLNFNSKTERNNQMIVQAEAKVNKNEKSYLKLRSNQLSANALYNPSRKTKQFEFDLKDDKRSINHKTFIEYQPYTQLKVNSETTQRGANILRINSNLQNNSQRKQATSIVDYRSSFKHQSELNYEPRTLTLISTFKQNNQNVLEVDVNYDKDAKSSINIENKLMKAKVDWEQNEQKKIIQVEAQIDHSLMHKTRIEFEKQKQIEIYSLTKRNGQVFTQFKSRISRQKPSYLRVNTQSDWNVSFEVDPFSFSKSALLKVNSPSRKIDHNSQVKYDRQEGLKFETKTNQNSRSIVEINSHINPRKNLYFNFNSADHSSRFETSPFENIKTFKFNHNNHKTQTNTDLDASYETGLLNLKSKRSQKGQTQAEINARLSKRDEASNFFGQYGEYQSEIEVDAFGHSKKFRANMRTPSYQASHSSKYDQDDKEFKFKSSSSYQDKELYNLETKYQNRGQAFVNFATGSHITSAQKQNLKNQKILNFDYQNQDSQRHIRTVINYENENEKKIEAELQWDADRNPEKKVTFSAFYNDDQSSRKVRSLSVSGQYMKHKVELKSEIPKKDSTEYLNARISLQHAQKPSKTVLIKHKFDQSEIDCEFKYIEGVEEKFQFLNQINHDQKQKSFNFKGQMSAKIDKQHRHLFWNHQNSRQRDQAQLSTFLEGQISSNQRYLLNINATQKKKNDGTTHVTAKAQARTPFKNLEQVNGQITMNMEKQGVKMNAEARLGNNKMIKMSGDYKRDENKPQVSIKVDSDSREVFPSFKAYASYTNERRRKEVEVTAESNGKTFVDAAANLNIESHKNFNADIKFTSDYYPKYEVAVKSTARNGYYNYEARASRDNDKILNIQVDARNQDKLIGRASVKVRGSEVFFASLDKKSNDSNEESYEFLYKGLGAKVNASHTVTDEQNQIDQNVELCVLDLSCYNFQSRIKNLKLNRVDKGQELTLLLENKKNSNIYRFDYRLKTREGFNAKMVANTNGKKVGYDVTAKSFNNEKQVTGKVYFFNHVSEAKAKQLNQGKDKKTYTLEFNLDASNNENTIKVEINKQQNSKDGRYHTSYDFKLEHQALQKPIQGKLEVKSKNNREVEPYSAFFEIDYAQNVNQKLFVEITVDNENVNENNKSISFHIYNQNQKQIDFRGKFHIAVNKNVASSGFLYQWLDRKGEKKIGYNYVEANFENKKFTLISSSPLIDVESRVHYQNENNEVSVNGTVQVNEISRKVRASLDLESQPCVELSLEDEKNNTNKFQTCVSVEKNRLLELQVQSQQNDKKSTDLLLSFDKRKGNVLKGSINWEPKSLSSIMRSLTQSTHFNRFNRGLKEVFEEMNHKRDLIGENLSSDVFRPMRESLAENFDSIAQDVSESTRSLTRALQKVSQRVSYLKQALDEVDFIPNLIQNAINSISKKMVQLFNQLPSYNKLNRRISSALEKNGLKEAFREAFKILKETAEQAQKVTLSTSNVVIQMSERTAQEVAKLTEAASQKMATAMEPLRKSKLAQKASQAVHKMQRKINDLRENVKETLLSNKDISSIVEIFQSFLNDIKEELNKVDAKDIARLVKEARNYVFSFKSLASPTRILVYNPKRGEIKFEVSSPVQARSIKSWLSSSQLARKYSQLRDSIKEFQRSVSGEWVPPFKTQAMIIGGQHYVTFDGTVYDFADSKCSYLLTQDFRNGNFSAIVKYNGQKKNGKIKTSLVVKVNNKNFEINAYQKSVKVDNNQVELPYNTQSVSVIRKGETIELKANHGLKINCDLEYDICSISLSGWYFGKTKGMFGTYDYESNNDMLLPQGTRAADYTELASNYEISDSCQTQNIARNQETRQVQAREACKKIFEDENSSLSDGFSVINPKDYQKMCLRHAEATKNYQNPEEAACTIAAAYATSLNNQNVQVNLPKECLSCDDGEQDGEEIAYGSRSKISVNIKKADIVLIIEENQCNEKVAEEIENIVKMLNRELKSNGFQSAQFGIVGFGGPQNNGKPHSHTAKNELLFNAEDAVLATERMTFHRSDKKKNDDDRVDTFEAIAYVSRYPFRKKASKNIILMSCTSCNQQNTQLDYTDIQQLLLSQGIVLHTVNDKTIEVKSSGFKTRGIYAVDASSVYLGRDHRSSTLEGQKELRQHVIVPKDVCAALAQESNGSYFTTQIISLNEIKQWRSLLARRVAKTANPHSCQNCVCVLDHDLLHSRTLCTPCQ